MPAMPPVLQQLPTITLDGKSYFVDLRLNECRAVDNPNERRPIPPRSAWCELFWRGPKRRPISLALSRNFDTRWVGELPVVFDGTVREVIAYAEERGYVWHFHDEMLLGGCFEHPTEPDTLYPV